MGWTERRISSQSSEAKEKLDEYNHISHFRDKLVEIIGLEYSDIPEKEWRGIEYTITAWADRNMKKDEEERPLDIIVYEKDGVIIWRPFVEHLMTKEYFKDKQKVHSIEFGYIEGKLSHLGRIRKEAPHIQGTGYVFFQQYK